MNIFDLPRGPNKTLLAGYGPKTDEVAVAICLTEGTKVVIGGNSVGNVLSHIFINRVEFIEWLAEMDRWARELTVEAP